MNIIIPQKLSTENAVPYSDWNLKEVALVSISRCKDFWTEQHITKNSTICISVNSFFNYIARRFQFSIKIKEVSTH